MALETPFGNQPGQLADPVPGAAAQPEVANPFAAAFEDAPSEVNLDAQEVAQAAPVTEVNPFAAAFDEQPPQPEIAMGGEVPSDLSTLPEPTGIASISEQLNESAVRFRNAWTSTDKESVGVLQQSGLFEDVRVRKGAVEVKRVGRKGYEKFDRDKAELIGDTIDLARIAFEGVAEAGLEIAGTAGITAATGGPGIAAQPAVGATAAVGALNAADFIAEKWVGVERDPERSRLLENSLTATFGAGFTWMSGAMGRRAAAKKLAREGAEIGVDAVTESMDQVMKNTKVLEDSGIRFDKATSEYVVTPSQAIGGTNPELRVTEEELTKQPGFRNFVKQRGEELMGAYDTLVGTVNAKSGNIGGEFSKKFKNLGDYFGDGIGKFRTLAKDRLKEPQDIPNVQEHFRQVTESLSNIPGKELADRIQGLYGLTESQTGIVMGRVKQVQKLMASGKITAAETDILYNSLRKQIDNSFGKPSGQAIADALIPLKNALRDDYATMIGKVVPADQQAAYAGFMQKYSTFKQGETALRGILKKSAISKKALVNELFEGPQALGKVKALKVVMDHEDPKMFRELSVEYFNKLANDTLKPKQGRHFNWNSMAKKFGVDGKTGLGKEMQDILLEGGGITREQFNAVVNLGQMHQNTNIKNMTVEGKMGLLKSVWNLNPWAGTGGAAKSNAMEDIAKHIGKDASFMEYLQEGGAEAFLKKFPNFKPAQQNAFMQWVDNTVIRSIDRPVTTLPGTVQKAVGVGVRRDALPEGTPMEGQ